MELIDVLDEKTGEKTGEIISKQHYTNPYELNFVNLRLTKFYFLPL